MSNINVTSNLPSNVSVNVYQTIRKADRGNSNAYVATVIVDGVEQVYHVSGESSEAVRALAVEAFNKTLSPVKTDKRDGSHIKGKIWVVSEKGRARINPEDFDAYVAQGYKEGQKWEIAAKIAVKREDRRKAFSGMVWVHNDTQRVRIVPEALGDFLAKGFVEGLGKFS